MKSKRTERPSRKERPEERPPAGPIDLEESVAGEEDPGAGMDVALDPPAQTGKARRPKPPSSDRGRG